LTTAQDEVNDWVKELKMKKFKNRKLDEQTDKISLVGI